jgi:hypothetical protein
VRRKLSCLGIVSEVHDASEDTTYNIHSRCRLCSLTRNVISPLVVVSSASTFDLYLGQSLEGLLVSIKGKGAICMQPHPDHSGPHLKIGDQFFLQHFVFDLSCLGFYRFCCQICYAGLKTLVQGREF